MVSHTDADALQRKAVKAANKKAELDKLNRDEAVSGLLKTEQGLAYLRWLIQIGRAIGHSPWHGEETQKTSFACGEHNVGLMILHHILEVDPAGLIKILQEQEQEKDEQRERNADIERANSGNTRQRSFDFGDGDDSGKYYN